MISEITPRSFNWALILVVLVGMTKSLTGGQLMSNGVRRLWKLSHLMRVQYRYSAAHHQWSVNHSPHYITFMGSPGLRGAGGVRFQSLWPGQLAHPSSNPPFESEITVQRGTGKKPGKKLHTTAHTCKMSSIFYFLNYRHESTLW